MTFGMAENHWNWQGGHCRHSKGYILAYKPGHPYASNSGYVPEHRLILEARLGRFIDPKIEDSHHLDACVTNNEPANLVLLSKKEHRRLHAGWKIIDGTWWKTCSRCKRFLVVEGNFYHRHAGHNEYMTQCQDCCRILIQIHRLRRKTPTILEIRCSWCGKPMATKDGQGQTGITHGLCPSCAKKKGVNGGNYDNTIASNRRQEKIRVFDKAERVDVFLA